MEFKKMAQKFQKNFDDKLKNRPLFVVDLDKDELWDKYLSSFPEGTNPLYRKRTEHDCSCCRHFIKEIGGTVYVDEELNVHSIFEFDTGSTTYQPVMDALSSYVKQHKICDLYLSDMGDKIGTAQNRETLEDGSIVTYSHFFVQLPQHLVHKGRATSGTVKSHFCSRVAVLKRSLEEISEEAVNTVMELIVSNTLYKGEEWKRALEEFLNYKRRYSHLTAAQKEVYPWVIANTVGDVIGRIRNHSIGLLLTDVSEGVELDTAVRKYEAIVAPSNYKRPKPIFTKKMLENAKKTITELGYLESLPRRFATLDDITVNNILFVNRDSAKRVAGSVFDELMSETKQTPKQFSRVEEIGIDKFISDVLPTAKEVEVYMENRHEPNMVSLIAPQNKDGNTMFKWNNGFSWAYAGNMTDSDIRDNVKKAGGKVDGVLRFSIQWNDVDHDGNDLDAHCIESFHNVEIFYGREISRFSGGNLDVDIINPKYGTPAVENITFPVKFAMHSGQYRFFVHCYNNRGGKSGFRAEIEFDGKVYRYDYRKALRQKENVEVATVTLDEHGNFSIDEKLPSQFTSRDVWNIKTNTFVPVSVIMYSPNYWDEQQGIGHRHYFFMLNGCVNPESPNGFYNEFLKQELVEHKRVFEALGSKMAVEMAEDQLSGLGFSSTKRNDLIAKVKGATERVMKIKF